MEEAVADLKSPHDLFPQTDAERALEIFAELAVLAALTADDARELFQDVAIELGAETSPLAPGFSARVDGFSQALAMNSMEWRQHLVHLAQAVPAPRRRVWLADNCMNSRFLESELLTGDAVMRRLDAVLDLADVPFCALDVQASMGTLAEDLASAKVTTSMRAGATAATAVLGFVGGWFGHVTAGAQAERGADYVFKRFGNVDPLAEQAARLVVVARAASASGDEQAPDEVAQIWRYLYGEAVSVNREHARLRQLPSGPGDLTRRSRIIEAAEQDARQLLRDPDEVVAAEPLPDTVGMSQLSASHLLETINVKVDTYDDTGAKRWQVNTEAWRVTKQVPSGRSVVLHVRKFSE